MNLRRKNRKNWFGREDSKEEQEEGILYNDIDITRTGFRNEEPKNNK